MTIEIKNPNDAFKVDPAGFTTETRKDGNGNSYTVSVPKVSTPAPVAEPAPSPSLIVTSGASRSNYNDNVNTLQKATSNITPSNPSVVDYLTQNNMPSDYNSRAALAVKYGIQGYTGSAAQNGQLLTMVQKGNNGSTTTTDETVKTPSATGGDTTDTKKVPIYNDEINHAPDQIASSTDQGDGTTIVTYKDGQTQVIKGGLYKDGSGPTTGSTDGKDTSGIDPVLKKQYDEALAGLDDGITQAKANLEAAKANLANDPAAQAAVDAIMKKYDQQIELMKKKNTALIGSYKTNAARSGSLQYANDMYSSFLSEEQDKASQRVTDLITEETQLVLKTQQAYKDGNIKALAQATKDYETANKEKIAAIDKLLTATDKMVKQQQAEEKAQIAKDKQAITDDIRVSTAIGKTLADTIIKSGVTDPKQIDEYVIAMAEKSGITNPDILRSAVLKAQGDAAKADLSAQNTKSIITNRGKKPSTGSNSYANFTKKPSASDVSKVNKYVQSIGGNDAALKAVNGDEVSFYKALNAAE